MINEKLHTCFVSHADDFIIGTGRFVGKWIGGGSVVKEHNLVKKMLYSNNETTCFSQ